MRQIFEMVLADENCAITAIARGNEALEHAREVQPHLIVADLTLDDQDGYQICDAVRRDAALGQVPVLLLYGPSVGYDEGRGRQVGASDALAKPFGSQELVDKVNALLGRGEGALDAPPARAPAPPAARAPAPPPAREPAPPARQPAPAARQPAPPPAREPAPRARRATPVPPPPAPPPQRAAPAPARPARPPGAQPKVLVVDDSATMRRVFELALAEDCIVTAVGSGSEALDAARAMQPDLVIADLSLPDKDGYQICAELRNDAGLAAVPVLLCHGSSVDYDAGRARQVQATDAMAKPFGTQELIDKVLELAS